MQFEENADLLAVAKRVCGGERFPEYFQVARNLSEEMELTVYDQPVGSGNGVSMESPSLQKKYYGGCV